MISDGKYDDEQKEKPKVWVTYCRCQNETSTEIQPSGINESVCNMWESWRHIGIEKISKNCIWYKEIKNTTWEMKKRVLDCYMMFALLCSHES